METNRFITVPGQGWMSRDAARVAYGLTDKELKEVFGRLKPIGGTCPRKGFSISGLEQCVRSVRGELGQ